MKTNQNGSENQMIVNAYSYSRISTTRQSMGAGLDRQDDSALRVCKQYGWTLCAKTLVDLGYSAYKGENIMSGALADFINAAKQGKLLPHPVLIIDDFSRFSRLDIDQSVPAFMELIRFGVAIHNAFSNKTYTKASLKKPDAYSEIAYGFKAAFDYSDNLSKKVNDAFTRKFALAKEGNAVEFGPWQPSWIDFIGPKKGIGVFKLNEQATLLREIVADYINGKSMHGIAKALNARKVPCLGRGQSKGKQWRQCTIRQLLLNEALIGNLVVKEHRFNGYYPSVIKADQWKDLQHALGINQKRKSGTKDNAMVRNVFANRCKCAKCGGSITTASHKSEYGTHCYYVCGNHRNDKTACNVNGGLRIDYVEQDFFLLYIAKQPEELIGKDTSEYKKQIVEITAEINETDSMINDAVKLLGKIPLPELETKLGTLRQSRAERLAKRESINHTMINSSNAPKVLTDIRKALANLSDEKGDFDIAAEQVIAGLQDEETRKGLLKMMPNLIDHLTIDIKQGGYTVTTLDGLTTPFRSVLELPTLP